MQHLDEGTLHAWLDRDRSGLTSAEFAEIAAHLGACPACARRLDEARSLAGRSAAILAGAAPSVVPPAFSEIQARAAGVGGAASAPRRRPWIPLGWAASIALALGLGWFGRGLVPGGEAAGGSGAPGAEGARLAAAPAESAPPGVEIALPAPTEPRVEAAAPALLPSQARVALAEEAAAWTEDRVADAAPTDLTIAPTVFDGDAARADQGAISDLPPPRATSGSLALRGRVTNPDGEPLAAVQVYVPGTGTGAVTDSDGSFALDLPASLRDTAEPIRLTAQRLGYRVAQLDLAAANDSVWADVELEPALLALQEIVATGLVDPVEGARSPISIAPVTRETMPVAVAGNPVENLQGGIADVQINLNNGERIPVAVSSWIPADLDEAARTFGAPIVFVPDLPVVEVEIGRLDGARAVRVVQEHPYGLLTLVQVRAAESTEPGSAALATGTVTLIVGEMRITGAGSLPADTVRALLEHIR
ncbi:MAG: carboxypeptidase-like regulatory domain-containing protein [Gemmatimonadota bacterium]